MSELSKLMEQLQTLQKTMETLARGEMPAPIVKSALHKIGTVTVATRKPTVRRKVAPNLVEDFIVWFIKAPEGELYNVKRGQWECKRGWKNSEKDKQANILVFHTLLTSKVADASNIVCIRPIGSKIAIFNGSQITYGTTNMEQKGPQAIAEAAGAVPIPFQSVVSKTAGAGLDLAHLEIVDWTGSEKMIIPPVRQRRWHSASFHVISRHFAGAAVVKIHDQYFLFDTDREELRHHGFNPFFTQLPHAVRNVKEAYAALMPQEVKNAIANGKRVVRQGELFFVPVTGAVEAAMNFGSCTEEHEIFFYNQLKQRLRLIGAATVNCYKRSRLEQVQKFVDLAKENNRGLLDDGKTTAEVALAAHMLALLIQEGPDQAHALKRVKKDDHVYSRNEEGLGHSDHHLRYIWDEAGHRCSSDPQLLDPNCPICLGAGIATGSNDPRMARAQHTATAMVAKSGSKAVFVMGAILHTGREHQPVFLNDWHQVYPNTAIQNWTVSGSVD